MFELSLDKSRFTIKNEKGIRNEGKIVPDSRVYFGIYISLTPLR